MLWLARRAAAQAEAADFTFIFLRLPATTTPPIPRASSRPRLTVVEASGTAGETPRGLPTRQGRT